MDFHISTDVNNYDYESFTDSMQSEMPSCLVTLSLPYTFDAPSIVHIICMPIIILLCTIGNIFVFHVLRKYKVYTTVSIFMRALAILDLSFVISTMPLLLKIETYLHEKHCGKPTKYNLFAFFAVFEIIMYLLIFVAMSCDRFYAVYVPFNYTNSRRRTGFIILILAIISMILSGIVIIEENSQGSMIGRTMFSIVIQLSLGIIISAYGLIIIKLRKQKRKMQGNNTIVPDTIESKKTGFQLSTSNSTAIRGSMVQSTSEK